MTASSTRKPPLLRTSSSQQNAAAATSEEPPPDSPAPPQRLYRLPWLLRAGLASAAFLLLTALVCALLVWSFGSRPPLASFGLISDAQYADVRPKPSALGVMRHYRLSRAAVRAAGEAWDAVSPPLAFVLHAGDLVDGQAREVGGAEAAAALLLQELARPGRPLHLLLGNHEFYAFGLRTRAELGVRYAASGGAPPGSPASRLVAPGVRLLLLDSYAVSALGRNESDAARVQAEALLASRRAGATGASPNDPSGLVGLERRWVALGGGLGAPQLAWLRQQLRSSAAAGERVIIASHVPLHPGAQSSQCAGMCVAWDYQAALDVLFETRGTVAASFAGHDHAGGYAQEGGVHFVTLQGVIETPPGGVAFAEAQLFERELVIQGHGRVESRRLRLPPLPRSDGRRGAWWEWRRGRRAATAPELPVGYGGET